MPPVRPATSVPVGTVTFLLTDVEGSSRLWERAPDATSAAIARHYELLGTTIAEHGGVRPQEQGEGDSVVAAFAQAADAVAAALDVQLRLQSEPWPSAAPLRVRIAIHTGEAQLRDARNYAGPSIIRCARLRGLARGGQVLLSGSTRDLVVDDLPPGATLAGAGEHRLRELERPEAVFELRHPELSLGPPGVVAAPRSGNLPAQLTSFVGRDAELAEIAAMLARTRLLTLTGVGGGGKTRLAIAAAQSAGMDSAWFVELATLADGELVGAALLDALGVAHVPGRPPLDVVVDHLRDRRAMLVLDGCEHLVAVVAAVAERLLRSCSQLTLLAASREPLRVAGELVWSVPSMSLPAPARACEPSDAVELFVERARAARPDFHVDPEAIARICRELDGLPLAIELAAARVRVMAVAQIADGLQDRFRLLAQGPRGAPARQQTLSASLDWSYVLLTELERVLLARLSVFAGGATLDAAEAVCCDDALPAVELLDVVAGLVDKSLLFAEERAGGMRYRMLATVREYAAQRLRERGEAVRLRDRHLDHYVGLAADAAHRNLMFDAEGGRALDAESWNVRAALQHAAQTGAPGGLAIVGELHPYWRERGRYAEGIALIELALASAPAGATAARARALGGLALLFTYLGESARALELGRRAAALGERVGDPIATAVGLVRVGVVTGMSDPPAARPTLERAVALARKAGHQGTLLHALASQVSVLCIAEDLDGIEPCARAVLELSERLGGASSAPAWAWWARGVVAHARGDVHGVRTFGARALHLRADIYEPVTRSLALLHLATADALSGDPEDVRGPVQAEIERATPTGSALALAGLRLALAELALARGELDAATAAAESVRGGASGYHEVRALGVLVRAALAGGDADRARDHAARLDALGVRLGHRRASATGRLGLGRAALLRGDAGAAEHSLRAALAALSAGGWLGTIDALEALGAAAAVRGEPQRAALLLAAAAAARARAGTVRVPLDERTWEPIGAPLRDGADWRRGASLALDDAVAIALGDRRAR